MDSDGGKLCAASVASSRREHEWNQEIAIATLGEVKREERDKVAVALAVITMMLAAGLWLGACRSTSPPPAPPRDACSEELAALDRAWTPARREQLVAARAFDAATAAPLTAVLDAQVTGWRRALEESCRADTVAPSAPSAPAVPSAPLPSGCAVRGAQRVAALIDQLAEPPQVPPGPPTWVVLGAVAALEPALTCREDRRPLSDAVRAAAPLDRQLAALTARSALGDCPGALAELRGHAAALSSPGATAVLAPMILELHVRLTARCGTAEETEATLTRVEELTEAAAEDEEHAYAAAWTLLAEQLAEAGRREEGGIALEISDGLVRKAGSPVGLTGRILTARATLMRTIGQIDLAILLLEGLESEQVATTRSILARLENRTFLAELLHQAGRGPEARLLLDGLEQKASAALSREHPLVARIAAAPRP